MMGGGVLLSSRLSAARKPPNVVAVSLQAASLTDASGATAPAHSASSTLSWALGVIDRVQSRYGDIIRRTVGFAPLGLIAAAIAAGAAFALFRLIPSGFLPEEDQGFFYAEIDLPPGASVNRTDALTEPS